VFYDEYHDTLFSILKLIGIVLETEEKEKENRQNTITPHSNRIMKQN
jgi:hypothetical protein